MDQAITRAAGATPRAVGEFQGFIDGEPSVVWADRKNMPQVGDKLFALPRQAAVPRSWSILLTSANHGTVGPVGSTFSHAGEHHERVQVMEIVEAGSSPAPDVDLAGLVRITIDGTVIPLAAPSAPARASTVLTDERIYDIAASTDLGIGDDEYEMSKRTAFARAIEREIAAQAGQVAGMSREYVLNEVIEELTKRFVVKDEPYVAIGIVRALKSAVPSPAKESK